MIWAAPSELMVSIDVLSASTLTSVGSITGEITPATFPSSAISYQTMPFSTRNEFSHMCITNALGPIDSEEPSDFRLLWNGMQFLIRRIRDWDGFYVLDLDEVVGG